MLGNRQQVAPFKRTELDFSIDGSLILGRDCEVRRFRLELCRALYAALTAAASSAAMARYVPSTALNPRNPTKSARS